MEDTGVMLEWKGYGSTTGTVFQNLYTDQDFTDVTLACEDNARLEAHKVILSSCSEFFSKILRQNPNPNPLIYLQGATISDLQLLKSFMYIGRARVNLDQMDGFLEVSKRFLNQPSDNATQKISDDTQSNILKTNKKEIKVKTEKKRKELFENESLESVKTELLSCPQCSFKGKSKKEVSRHRFKRHVNQNLVCGEPDCGKVFKHRSILKDHVKKKHMGLTKEYLCENCDYSSKWSSSFMRHRSKHTGNQKLCQHCQYSCPTNHMLRKHLESKHSEIEYDCGQCDVKTRTRRMMKFHVKKVHEGVRFYCELCSHQATTAYNLKAHKQRTHDQVEFKCTFCHFKDSEKSRVILHERRTHGDSSSLKAITSLESETIQ